MILNIAAYRFVDLDALPDRARLLDASREVASIDKRAGLTPALQPGTR